MGERPCAQKSRTRAIETLVRRKSFLDGNLQVGRADQAGHPLGFAAFAAIAFRGFLVIAVSLDIPDQALFFAHFFESLDHLLDAFTGP